MSNLPAYTAAEKVTVRCPDYLPDYTTIQNTVMVPVFQEVLAGKTSVEDMMDMWATEMEKAYKEYTENIK